MVATTPNRHPQIPWYQRLELPTLLPAFLLAYLMVWSVVQSVADANWANGLQVLVSIAMPAFVVGLVFARLHWLPGWLAHTLAAALGIAWSVQQVGPLLVNEISFELGPAAADRLASWGDRATEIVIRGITLGRLVQSGGRGEDIVLFIVALALLVWVLGYVTSWLLFRAGWTWWAVVINALVILVNYTFTLPKPNALFFLFLGCALLLIAYQHVVQQQRTWQSALMDYPEYISWRFLAAATLFCGAIVLVTSILPSDVSSAQVARAWRIMSSPFTAAREGWEVAFSNINAPPGTSGGGFSTQSVRVGGGRVLGDEVVMYVYSTEYDYWRANAMDRYTGRGWNSTVGERQRAAVGVGTFAQARSPLDPQVMVPLNEIAGRTLVTQTVELVQERNDDLLMFGGQFVSASIPVLVEHGYVAGDGLLQPNFVETTSVSSQLPLRSIEAYQVSSLISRADVQSLRQAGTNYPAWVTDHYLELPESVTQRTLDEARRIIELSGATNPYDQAQAVQTYLRRFTYDEMRNPPPDDRDWADYFLFDTQRGYCDDFATAMVVLLRANGIPARFVQGYAGGTLDPESGAYIVRQSVAHTWPEVYFPGYGWQRFEPTPASYANMPTRPEAPSDLDGEDILGPPILPPAGTGALLDRELLEMEEAFGGETMSPEELRQILEGEQRAEQQQQWLFAGGVLALLAGLAGSVVVALNWNLRGLSPAAVAFTRLARLAGWAGLRHQAHQTPTEYASELKSRLPEQRRQIDRIVRNYVAERYSNREPTETEYLNEDWQQLRRPLIVRLFTRFTEGRKERKSTRQRSGSDHRR